MNKGGNRRLTGGGGEITRRDFLGGAAAGPILAATGAPAFAVADPAKDKDKGAALVFIISSDERSVIVRRLRPPNADGSPSKEPPHTDWPLEAEAFGPRAWFDLDEAEYDTRGFEKPKAGPSVFHRWLVVRDVSWGRYDSDGKEPLHVTFDFKRSSEGAWDIGITTNVWPSAKANTTFHTEEKLRRPLHDFIANSRNENSKRLRETVSAARISSALAKMFDSQLAVSRDLYIDLDCDIVWHLEPTTEEDRPIAAFGGAVEAPLRTKDDKAAVSVEVRWEQGEEIPVAQGRRLTARCPAVWKSFTVAASGNAPAVEVAPQAPDTQKAIAAGSLYVGQLAAQSKELVEGGVDPSSVIAMFSTPAAVLTCRGPAPPSTKRKGSASAKPNNTLPSPLCTGLRLEDVTITRIKMDVDQRPWRDVVVADAGGSRNAATDTQSAATASAPGKPAKSDHAENGRPDRQRISTSIGRLDVGPLPADTAALSEEPNPNENAEQKAKREARRKFEAVSAAAIGDRSGVSERSFYLLVDRPTTSGETRTADCDLLQELYADVALYGLDAALPGTSDSSMAVDGSHFRFVYTGGRKLPGLIVPKTAWGTPDGYLWLGDLEKLAKDRKDPLEIGRLDLGGTALHARRDQDLVDVRFHFADFLLGFATLRSKEGKQALQLTLRPARPDARKTVARLDLAQQWQPEGDTPRPEDERRFHVIDGRPILAVEFTPQHVMEEAFFRQDPAPLPDTAWPKQNGTLQSFLDRLREEPSVSNRQKMRREIGEAKAGLEPADPEDQKAPKPFASLRETLQAADLPEDQREYFGPYAMSADAIRKAREWQADWDKKPVSKAVDRMLAVAGKVNPSGDGPWTLEKYLEAEAEAEKLLPLYKLWRDAFRAYVIERGQANSNPGKAEFVNSKRASAPPPDVLPDPTLLGLFTETFIKQISGRQPFERLAMARLSGRSLLSFRVNFEPAPGDSSEVNLLAEYTTDSPASPGPGAQRFGSMPFTFEALTDWSRHEPHVTQRSQKLYEPLASGALPPVAGRVASVDDHAILRQQGFKPGAKKAQAHLDQVVASLNRRPEGFETHIELPARVILSTAQNAIWQAPRKVLRNGRDGLDQKVFATDPAAPPKPDPKTGELAYTSYEPLWTARLVAGDAEPGLRAVWSPDVRPEAIGFVAEHSAGTPRLVGAPPRGPWAPWVLRREQVDGVRVSPIAVKKAIATAEGGADAIDWTSETDDTACPVPGNGVSTIPDRTPNMFERICEIFRLRSQYLNKPDLHTFYTSLDAYDRHELVLLTSAYGLPVTGRRQQVGSKDTDSGGLVEKSGQFEAGEDFHLTDADKDFAFYRPKTLDVSELSLSALGGFLNHDTNFLPPAPGLNYEGRSMFDGLSIERWQHQIVLGRDVLVTVVYSGYLFPIGHKASLVKITERIFVQMRDGGASEKDSLGVKAVLRQRMFVRVSSPTKKFPSVGQPNKGRQWCSEDVTILTRETPDIVDPTFEFDVRQGVDSPSGRIVLDGEPGLAFWPQTAATPEARVRFEFLLDGRRTRMPLIFVDRIAAKNQAALKALIQHYNGLDDMPRTAWLAGQTLRFAEAVKDGDTSFAAERIVLSAEGRASNDGSWEGANEITKNTGVLEGADQPPFYPVMSSARIRIEQAECLSGGSIGPVEVRFDGSYVLRGFPPRRDVLTGGAAQQDSAGELASRENAAEAFLYVDMQTPPSMSMGPNGNQSGGVGRPNMNIVAISRAKGTLGAQPGQKIYQYEPSKPEVGSYVTKPRLLSVAKYFSMPPPVPAPAVGQAPSSNPAAAATENDNSAVFESFFSADAKLLGVISFQSLMKLLTLAGGVDAIPVLQEAVEYGSQALKGIEEGAADALTLLRSEILSPLLVLVRSARKEWSNLDSRQIGAQQSVIATFKKTVPGFEATSLRTLYPEIDKNLNNLEAALVAAIGETDAMAIAGRLATVHEAGRSFMRELARLAANPLDRIEYAARVEFAQVAEHVGTQLAAYQAKAKDVVDQIKTFLKANVAQLQDRVIEYLVGDLPWGEISALRRTIADGDVDQTITKLRDIKVDLKPIVDELQAGTLDPKGALRRTLELFLDKATEAATRAEAALAPGFLGDSLAKQAQRAAVALYKARLATARTNIGGWIEGNVDPVPDWAEWVARVKTLQRLVNLVQRLQESTGPADTFAIVVEFGRDFLGADLSGLPTQIRDRLSAILVALAGEIAARLATLASDLIPAPSAIDPALPPSVIARCIARLPVTHQNQADDVASDIANKHFLNGFAESAAKTFELDAVLAEGLQTLVKFANLPGSDKVGQAINGIKSALPNYRELFCTVTTVVGNAQQSQAALVALLEKLSKPQGNPPAIDPNVIKDTLAELGNLAREIEKGLRDTQRLVRLVVANLAPHLNVIATAAAAGALVDAFKSDLKDLKDQLEQWDKSVAAGVKTSLNAVFRMSGVIATTAAAADTQFLETCANVVIQLVPGALDPERQDLAGALRKLDTVSVKQAAGIATFSISAPADASLKQLLDSQIVSNGIGTVTIRAALNGDAKFDTKAVEDALNGVRSTFAALVGRAEGLPKTLVAAGLDAPVNALLNALVAGYEKVSDLRTNVVNATAGYPVAGEAVKKAFLIEPLGLACNPLSLTCDKLVEEQKAAKALALVPKPVTDGSVALQAFADSIAGGRSAVAQIVENVKDIWDDIARGDLAALVDIAAMRDQVEELILQLLPVKRTLRYSLGFDFDAGKIEKLSGGVFMPKPPGRFELDMIATIDLLRAKAEMNASGRIGPFDIQLIGSIFDAVTLIFDGIDFSFELGGSPRFDVHYRDFKIGSELQFVQQLQAYMTPSRDGSGFFIEPMRGRPGIVAGYGLNLGTIQLGGIAFSNVLLNAAAELPFDGQAAIFRFALGRTLAPFLISVPPYGGGGFVAIYADAKGFRGFEASFEFGGVADFSTGPLVATGRLTTGFYIRSMKVPVSGGERTVTDIYGTFFAGGEASIWIFSFYASLYVRLGMKQDGTMEGVATFTFSFSMGLADFDFQVTVSHSRGAFGGGGGGGRGGGQTGFLGVDRSIMTAGIPHVAETKGKKHNTPSPNVLADASPLSAATMNEFLRYFDLRLLEPESGK
ncbi:twin-arginine translocation signal domain-containing protein [Mesorhizobium muleiense]|uniref:twin-arginine translocation signal domain-containing protein n=1 Tax=Mesorhizobium muleiense TaxID=1004279 RepID=UPI001F314411|nr:twin-arginine translocation signal domain-containing protein [Mesorhizobium muleiense]MCF6117114.1 twin-arginine translocation signal domain-containing protein [Mesorhizobium muleiense]